MPNLVHYLNRAPIYEWYMVNCGIKNGYQKNLVFEEIKSCAQNMTPIPCSRINIYRENLLDHLRSTRILALIMNKTFI